MMDLKEIIKWFIPCFHILRVFKVKINLRLICICLFLLFNIRYGVAAAVTDKLDANQFNITKNVGLSTFYQIGSDKSDYISEVMMEKGRPLEDRSIGRTFGRPFKKMAQALIPLAFQIGAASTWAVVAALVGVKTLVVALIILKLLLVAGAAKIGALFGTKGHHAAAWEPPHPYQKEIHLHIHNGHHEVHDDHAPPTAWSRDGASDPTASDSNSGNNVNILFDPYSGGPQTISTPFGNYVKLDTQSTHTTAFYR